MRSRSELEFIKKFIETTYNRWGNLVMVSTDKPFDPNNPELGYCFKYRSDSGDSTSKSKNNNNRVCIIYRIVCSSIGIERTDFRVMMHEYGHIYLGHLDGIHEELDSQICNVFDNYRGELIEAINKECGIDFADKLIERVIDDPVLNHSIHNIAMDMEVNSKILSKDDIEEMEQDITSVLPKYKEEYLKYIRDKITDEEKKKEIDKALERMKNESKIKLIIPERYHLSDGNPFPTGLTYSEYLMLIIKNLDQFVKMMVSIKMGGSGDTSNITSEDIKKALSGRSNNSGNGGENQDNSGDSGSSGMQGLSDLMEEMGMSSSSSGSSGNKDSSEDESSGKGSSSDRGNGSDSSDKSDKKSPYKGIRDANEKQGEGGSSMKDHRTDSRDEADRKRELGQITSNGGLGCSSRGTSDATRLVNKNVDSVEMALEEVVNNFRTRVVKHDYRRDWMYLYNRGINTSVIAPTTRRKVSISTDPTIVFLIDVSGSMDTRLIDRILKTISEKIKRMGRGLKYNIISWSTELEDHIKNIDPRKGVPRISSGGGTRIARGIRYFRENYDTNAILIIISDFEDYLDEWAKEEASMKDYTMYGFNYGSQYYNCDFKYIKVKKFNGSYR